jgi:hypothetical protein
VVLDLDLVKSAAIERGVKTMLFAFLVNMLAGCSLLMAAGWARDLYGSHRSTDARAIA